MLDFDELLGRAPLKERIAELEEERDSLEARYKAESERRTEAATARQDAERRVNKLEDRIAQLEGELERVQTDEPSLEYRRRERISGGACAAVVDRLQSMRTDSEGAYTATFSEEPLADLDDSIASLLGDRTALLADATPCLCCVDDAGLVAVTLDPPIRPTIEPTWADRFSLERSWFLPEGTYTLAVVRADLFAMGTYEDGERREWSGFESEVKGSHSKGGFSQARFERIRNEQIDAHLDRCLDALDAIEEPLYLVGQRPVFTTLIEESGLEPAATAAVDATGSPRSALSDAHQSFWTTDLRVL